MFSSRSWCGGLATAALLAAAALTWVRGAEEKAAVWRDDFESARPAWHDEETDASIRLIAHERSKLAAHAGRFAERFQFQAGAGSAFYVSYSLPKVAVNDALAATLYVRANRAGAQLFGRVVLPDDKDPDTGQPSFVLVPGPIYDRADRWQKLELIDVRQAVERQARVLRASTKRPVPLDGAFLERVVVNLYSGEGETEVFLDDLAVSPVPADLPALPETPPLPSPSDPQPTAPKPGPRRESSLELIRNRLKRNRYDWFFTAVRAPDADVAKLRRAGCDVLVEDMDADPRRVQDAVAKGFLLMPVLGKGTNSDAPPEPGRLVADAAAYPFRDSVAFWHLGEHLGRARDAKAREAEVERIRKTISGFRKLSGGFSRLTTATVDGDVSLYSAAPRNLDVVGIQPNPWGTMQQPFDTFAYMNQRRALGARWNAGGLYWAWIPATSPRVVQNAIWGEGVLPPAWGVPQVQPDQLRMYTYIALAAGYRGIGYLADAELTRPGGKALLIEMALLNEEIDLFESVLANSADPIPLYKAFPPDPSPIPPPGGNPRAKLVKIPETQPHPSIKASAIGTLDRKGVLLLLHDFADRGQFQPTQMAEPVIEVTVIVPEGAQACEISPGGIRWLKRERVPGGTRIRVSDFGGTSLLLISTDLTLSEQIEASLVRVRPTAVNLAIEQAELLLASVAEINERLVLIGHPLKDATTKQDPSAPAPKRESDTIELLKLARKSIEDAREARDREDYLMAWTEARRASRPLRVLMRAHWVQAVEELVKYAVDADKAESERLAASSGAPDKKFPAPIVVPTSSPACVAYNTLPKHYELLDFLMDKKTGEKRFGENLAPSGSFDQSDQLESAGWTNHGYQYVGITSKVSSEPRGRDGRRPALKMKVEAADPQAIDALPPFLDFPAAAIRSPSIPIGGEHLYRISVWIKRPTNTSDGVGGVIVQDSIGGEPLQFRSSIAFPEWIKVILYRRAPADGELTVTLGLAGYGEVYFDDFKVERLEEVRRAPAPSVAGPTRRRTVPPSTATLPKSRERSSR